MWYGWKGCRFACCRELISTVYLLVFFTCALQRSHEPYVLYIYIIVTIIVLGFKLFSTTSPSRPGRAVHGSHVRNHDLQTAVTVFIQHCIVYCVYDARLPLCSLYTITCATLRSEIGITRRENNIIFILKPPL